MYRLTKRILIGICIIPVMLACSNAGDRSAAGEDTIPVIFDTDANNELDDQHAIAYLLLNREAFRTIGITVNATRNGGGIESHVEEAERIVKLAGMEGEVPVIPGADGSFPEIAPHIEETAFDGRAAVDFIIGEAVKERPSALVLLPVGKLTNIALALLKEPAIAGQVRVVWLGSNYPEPGEYNQQNDTAALNFILDTDVPFEIATVRYGKPSGTAAVTVTKSEIMEKMPGMGPRIEEGVTGRHGGEFHTFGDYSVSLFEHIEYYDENQSRSLFDMAAVAIVKEPSWAETDTVPAPLLIDNRWVERPDNPRRIVLWENFDKQKILADFFRTLEQAAEKER